jgi:hypothetical protein
VLVRWPPLRRLHTLCTRDLPRRGHGTLVFDAMLSRASARRSLFLSDRGSSGRAQNSQIIGMARMAPEKTLRACDQLRTVEHLALGDRNSGEAWRARPHLVPMYKTANGWLVSILGFRRKRVSAARSAILITSCRDHWRPVLENMPSRLFWSRMIIIIGSSHPTGSSRTLLRCCSLRLVRGVGLPAVPRR